MAFANLQLPRRFHLVFKVNIEYLCSILWCFQCEVEVPCNPVHCNSCNVSNQCILEKLNTGGSTTKKCWSFSVWGLLWLFTSLSIERHCNLKPRSFRTVTTVIQAFSHCISNLDYFSHLGSAPVCRSGLKLIFRQDDLWILVFFCLSSLE